MTHGNIPEKIVWLLFLLAIVYGQYSELRTVARTREMMNERGKWMSQVNAVIESNFDHRWRTQYEATTWEQFLLANPDLNKPQMFLPFNPPKEAVIVPTLPELNWKKGKSG